MWHTPSPSLLTIAATTTIAIAIPLTYPAIPTNPQAAVYVIEAQLALLLRLAGAGGPGGRMGSAKALQDAGAITYLCRWGVIAARGGGAGAGRLFVKQWVPYVMGGRGCEASGGCGGLVPGWVGRGAEGAWSRSQAHSAPLPTGPQTSACPLPNNCCIRCDASSLWIPFSGHLNPIFTQVPQTSPPLAPRPPPPGGPPSPLFNDQV